MPPPTTPFPAVDYVHDRRRAELVRPHDSQRPVTYGIALSGGGSRSLSASTGVLRGLKSVGVLDTASHMSGVSGGGWATSTYTFAQGRTQDEVIITSRAGMAPADITPEFLDAPPPTTSMLYTATKDSLESLCLTYWRFLVTSWVTMLDPDASLTTALSKTCGFSFYLDIISHTTRM